MTPRFGRPAGAFGCERPEVRHHSSGHLLRDAVDRIEAFVEALVRDPRVNGSAVQ